jgi:hypothetical protein
LSTLVAVHPVADGDDGIEAVELDLVGLGFALHRPVGSGYFQNGNNHCLHQLARLEDVLQVLADGGHVDAEKLGQRLLGHPEIFVTENDLDALFAVGRAVEDDFVGHGGN